MVGCGCTITFLAVSIIVVGRWEYIYVCVRWGIEIKDKIDT